MTDPDPLEEATRAAVWAMAQRSLRLIEELPDQTSTLARTLSEQRPEPATDLAGALRVGWLVAAPETDRGVRPTGPLAGLAVAVKDVIDVAGLPVRNGTPGGCWREPSVSAPAWQRLADAGATCVGKSATHEMAWGVTTPQIPHPLDPELVAGGSSGGSAACVAAGITPAALGTDTGGSVRIPAALCGVVGFRPTSGSVDMRGVTPLAPTQDAVGPLACDTATGIALLEVLLGRPLGPTVQAGVRGLRLGVLTRTGPLDEATLTAYDEALVDLRRQGAEIVPVHTDALRWAGSVSLLTMLVESAALHAATVTAAPQDFGAEARVLLTLGRELAGDAPAVAEARRQLTAHTVALLDQHTLDAIVTPTTACVAPRRDRSVVTLGAKAVPIASALTRFTAWASAIGLPAVSVPLRTSGLPVGLQVMARALDETTCARVARAVEAGSSG